VHTSLPPAGIRVVANRFLGTVTSEVAYCPGNPTMSNGRKVKR
jgi:hypothetical protein